MCQDQGCLFAPIDLRWGITGEQSADGQVINICLGAVEESRPFFITFLGERYGWCHATDTDGVLYQQTLDNGVRACSTVQIKTDFYSPCSSRITASGRIERSASR